MRGLRRFREFVVAPAPRWGRELHGLFHQIPHIAYVAACDPEAFGSHLLCPFLGGAGEIPDLRDVGIRQHDLTRVTAQLFRGLAFQPESGGVLNLFRLGGGAALGENLQNAFPIALGLPVDVGAPVHCMIRIKNASISGAFVRSAVVAAMTTAFRNCRFIRACRSSTSFRVPRAIALATFTPSSSFSGVFAWACWYWRLRSGWPTVPAAIASGEVVAGPSFQAIFIAVSRFQLACRAGRRDPVRAGKGTRDSRRTSPKPKSSSSGESTSSHPARSGPVAYRWFPTSVRNRLRAARMVQASAKAYSDRRAKASARTTRQCRSARVVEFTTGSLNCVPPTSSGKRDWRASRVICSGWAGATFSPKYRKSRQTIPSVWSSGLTHWARPALTSSSQKLRLLR